MSVVSHISSKTYVLLHDSSQKVVLLLPLAWKQDWLFAHKYDKVVIDLLKIYVNVVD